MLIALLASSVALQPPVPSPRGRETKHCSDTQRQCDRPVSPKPVALAASVARPVPAEQAQHQESSGEQEARKDWWKVPDWWVVIFTGIICSLTAALAYYTARLWGETKKAVSEAAESSERQLRAYISVTDIHIEDIDFSKGEARIVFSFRNSGQTPAYEVQNAGHITFKPASDDTWIIEQAPFFSKGTVGPGDTLTRAQAYNGLNADFFSQLVEKGHSIFYYGEIKYRDAFGKHRFCRYRRMLNEEVGFRNTSFILTQEGNESD